MSKYHLKTFRILTVSKKYISDKNNIALNIKNKNCEKNTIENVQNAKFENPTSTLILYILSFNAKCTWKCVQ